MISLILEKCLINMLGSVARIRVQVGIWITIVRVELAVVRSVTMRLDV